MLRSLCRNGRVMFLIAPEHTHSGPRSQSLLQLGAYLFCLHEGKVTGVAFTPQDSYFASHWVPNFELGVSFECDRIFRPGLQRQDGKGINLYGSRLLLAMASSMSYLFRARVKDKKAGNVLGKIYQDV